MFLQIVSVFGSCYVSRSFLTHRGPWFRAQSSLCYHVSFGFSRSIAPRFTFRGSPLPTPPGESKHRDYMHQGLVIFLPQKIPRRSSVGQQRLSPNHKRFKCSDPSTSRPRSSLNSESTRFSEGGGHDRNTSTCDNRIGPQHISWTDIFFFLVGHLIFEFIENAFTSTLIASPSSSKYYFFY